MTLDNPLRQLAEQLGANLRAKNLHLTLAESCTGGLCAELVTQIAGSSAWFECGFVTYSNASKQRMLNVSEHVITTFGAVSEEVAVAMVLGALAVSGAQLSAAVTGIAGPTGGSEIKPVGTVWVAWATVGEKPIAQKYQFKGTRQEVRQQSATALLQGLIKLTL